MTSKTKNRHSADKMPNILGEVPSEMDFVIATPPIIIANALQVAERWTDESYFI